MGQEDEHGRCVEAGVTRILDATATAAGLGIVPGTLPACTMLVTDLADGRVLAPADYAALPGFAPRLVWAKRGWVPAAAQKPVAATSCCSKPEEIEPWPFCKAFRCPPSSRISRKTPPRTSS
jgi:hypothetical protein